MRAAETGKSTVIVATYSHRHGNDIRVFADDTGAKKWMREIAKEWWDHEFPDDPIPDDPDDAAEQYFERKAESADPEWFETTEQEIE